MKQKVTAAILILCMMVALTGCGDQKKEVLTPKPTIPVTETPTPEPTETPTPTVTAEPVPTEEANTKKIEIVLPPEVMQYASVEGIKLEKGTYIAMVGKNTESGYWKAIKTGAKQAISELNTALGYTGDDKIKMSFEGPKVESDIENQINVIDAVLADNPNALCLGVIDMNSCQAQLETAHENGIPVIVMDSGTSDELESTENTVCATNNWAMGAEAARRLSEAVGDVGKIAVIAHQQNTQTSIDRVQGFCEEISQNHPQIVLTEPIYENAETDLQELTEQLLTDNPDLKGVFCTNETVYRTVREKLQAVPEGTLQIIGVDSGDMQIQDVKAGKELGFLSQNPYAIGYATVVAASRTIAKEQNLSFIDTGFCWVDAENIETEEIRKYLYK